MSIRRAQDERIEGTPDGLNAISEIMDVPDAPTIGTALDNDSLGASVTFTAAVTGGTPASYTVTSTPGSITGTGASSPITVSGLNAGTAYTFKVKAANAAGIFSQESVASNSVTPLFPVVGSYDSLASVTLSSNTPTITFAGIPRGYTHLQLRVIARSDHPSFAGVDGILRFNNDTTANYNWHYLLGFGTGVAASGTANASSITTGILASANGSSPNIYAATIIDILDYANVNKNTTTRALGGLEPNQSSGRDLRLASGSWRNTAAVTSITLTTSPTQNFIQYSQFALYGVK